MIARAWALVRFLLSTFLIGGVRIYQVAVRPILPPLCRFQPSCSEYMIEAVNKYGPLHGACKGMWRICRCNPLNRGGYDPP
jgi:putative membrane protein insertion efficiency factor